MKQIYFYIFISFVLVSEITHGQCSNLEWKGFLYEGEGENLCENVQWVLAFEDNFDGDNLDLSKWEYDDNDRLLFCTGEEIQYYTYGENIEVSGGYLSIITEKVPAFYALAQDWKDEDEMLDCDGVDAGINLREFKYRSDRIRTRWHFPYGRFEAKIIIPRHKGIWPAFWTFAGNPHTEIDIFEFWNENDKWGHYDPSLLGKKMNMNFHGTNSDGDVVQCLSESDENPFYNNFYTFKMEWSVGRILWYKKLASSNEFDLERIVYSTITMPNEEYACELSDFSMYYRMKSFPIKPMKILLNVAVQSDDDEPDEDVFVPMRVDYVRYYCPTKCNDINITNSDSYPVINQVFNAIVAKNITFDCSYEVPTNQMIKVIAKERIVLKPGFNAEKGSKVSVSINSEICDIDYKSINIDNEMQLTLKPNDGIITSRLFPNPSKGSFKFQFDNHPSIYKISIFDIMGAHIFSQDNIEEAFYNVELNNAHSGVYLLYVLDKNSYARQVYKFIIE